MTLEYLTSRLLEQSQFGSFIYLPAHLFLWAFLPSEIRYYRRHSPNGDHKTTSDLALSTVKTILIMFLIVLVILDVRHPSETSFVVRIFESLSYFVALALLHLGAQYNVHDQTFLLSFWTLELSINCIRVVDRITLGNVLPLGIELVLILLIWWSTLEKEQECRAIVQPNLIRSISFSWFSEISNRVHRSQTSDLGDLEDALKGDHLVKYFREGKATKGQYESVTVKDKKPTPEITMWSLLKPFGWDLVISGINRFVLTILFFVCPFLLRQILRNDRQTTTTEDNIYVISIFIVSLVIAALNGQYLYDTQKIGLKIKSILMILIYEKSLNLKTSSNTDITLLTLDSARFVDLLPNLHLIWSGPLIIIISIAGLLATLGKSAWIGVVVMITTIYLTKLITDKLRLLQKDLMDRKDPRIASTNEAIGMIKQIKFFCWEAFFQRRILQHRERELRVLRSIIYWDAPKYLLGVISPFLVSLASFGLMILIGDAPLLTLESVFVSIALFNILKYPLSVLPVLSSTWTATRASVDRINEFLKAEEIPALAQLKQSSSLGPRRTRNFSETFGDVLMACRKALDSPVVSLQDLSVQIDKKMILQDVDLRVKEGSFVIVTGSVGCGKSSLLAAIMGELSPTEGVVSVTASISYVSQEPWILHRSIRENILFGQQFNEALYDQVLQACALVADLESFPNKDQTIIGEKGTTVSGGQKQRIALARAIYEDAELYLLDDPLSSVDGEVSEFIYSRVFSKDAGLLNGKTVIMVTQDYDHFKDAELILVMDSGRISETHTYESYNKKYLIERSVNKNNEKSDEMPIKPTTIVDRSPEIKASQNSTHKISPKLYLKYLSMLGTLPVIVILLFNIAIPICDIYSTIWLAKWSIIDHQTATLEDHFYLEVYTLFVFGMIIFLSLNSAAITVRGISVAKSLHNELLHNTIHQQMSFFDRKSSGQIMNHFSSDLDVADSKISLNLRDLLTNLTSVVSILILFCFNTSYYIVIILAAIVLAYCFLLFYHLETSRHLKRMEARSKSPVILHFNESREGRSIIRAFRREDHFTSEFRRILDRHQHFFYLYLASSRWLGIRLEVIGAIIIYFVTMLAVHNQDVIGSSSVGVSISYALRLIPLLNALIRTTALVEENATSLERIDHYLKDSNELSLVPCDRTPPENWLTQGKIEFMNFSMEYQGQNGALKDVTLTVEDQEKIGIVGRTGAGKSSLISALFRLYPTQTKGTIAIDNVNIDSISLEQLRRSLTIIPQSPLLFSGTLRENLDPYGDYPNESDLWNALDCCNLKQLVAAFPKQLDTVIDERGSSLSVGQKQLLCLARGILRNSRIVILDEATSAMDSETERVIQSVIFNTFRDCTVLMIAHRVNTIQQVDRVLCMRQGRVVKFDRPNRLDEQDLMEL